MNISSIIVKTLPKNKEQLINLLKSSDFCEYHLSDEKGNIIVTIEGKGVDEELKKLKKILQLPNVISANMTYSYSEEELKEERLFLDNTDDNLPKWMNDDNASVHQIVYKGDLRKKDL